MSLISNLRILKDAKVLSQRYLPEKLLFLDKQKRDLGIYLGYVLNDNVPPHMLLIGPRGTGKSTLIAIYKQELLKTIQERGFNVKIGYTHAPQTAFSAFVQLANDVGVDVPSTGISYDLTIARYEKACPDSISIFIIDEIDKIKDINDLLIQLTKRNEINSGVKGYCIIGLTNKQRIISTIDSRNLSSFNHRIINTYEYDATQTYQILSDRVDKAFHRNTLEDGVLEKISAHAAQRKGDCRFGLDVLLQAAELAEKESSDKLSINIVDKAIDDVEFRFLYDTIARKTLTQQYLLLKIALDKNIKGTLLYQWYSQVLGNDALTSRRISEYLNELIDDQFIERYYVRVRTGKQSWLRLFGLESSQVIIAIATKNFLKLYGANLPDDSLDKIKVIKGKSNFSSLG